MRVIEKKIFCVLLLFVLLISTGICLAEEPVAERPIYTAGDYWIFITQKGKQRRIEFVKEEDNKYIFSKKKNIYSTEGEDLIKDFELSNVKKKTHRVYPGPIIKFPLKVGKKWNYKFDSKGAITFHILAQYKVETFEQILVTAGKFWAFKISSSREPIDAPRGKITTTQISYYWYSPEVKQIIKKEWKGTGKFTELKEYKIN